MSTTNPNSSMRTFQDEVNIITTTPKSGNNSQSKANNPKALAKGKTNPLPTASSSTQANALQKPQANKPANALQKPQANKPANALQKPQANKPANALQTSPYKPTNAPLKASTNTTSLIAPPKAPPNTSAKSQLDKQTNFEFPSLDTPAPQAPKRSQSDVSSSLANALKAAKIPKPNVVAQYASQQYTPDQYKTLAQYTPAQYDANYSGPQIALARTPIITHENVATLLHRISSAGQPLSISKEAARFVAVFIDNLVGRMFSIGNVNQYDIDAIVMLFAPLKGNVRAVTSPIPMDIAELIRENGREAIVAANHGHSVLAAVMPSDLMVKVRKYKSSSGQSVELNEEAAVFLASTIEYLVTEVGSAVYQHDFKAFITSRDVKAIVTVNDEALSKMYAFADPRTHRTIMDFKNSRNAWNTPTSRTPRRSPIIPKEWGTPLSSRTARVSWNGTNRSVRNTNARDPWSGTKTQKTPLDFMRDFMGEKERRSPTSTPSNNSSDSLFTNADGVVPRALVADLFKKAQPRVIKYMDMRLTDVFNQIEFMEVRRAFPEKNFGGQIDAEFNRPDPLFGYIPKRDMFVATFTANERTIAVHFKVRKNGFIYASAEEATEDYDGSRRLAIYGDRRYVWILMR
jgi:hypothetical protein